MRGKGVRMIPFDLIDETTIRNPRTDLGDIDELVDSFRRNGQLVPIVVRQAHFGGRGAPEDKLAKLVEPPKGKVFDIYYLIAGQRRIAVMKRLREEARAEQEKLGKRKSAALPFDEVMAVVREGNEADAKVDQIIENMHRKDMNPIETAEAIKELDNLSYPVSDIALRIGRSEQWCRQLLALRSASIDLTRAVARDKLPLSVAFTIMKKPIEDQKSLVEGYKTTAETAQKDGGGKRAAKRKVEVQAGKTVRMPFKMLRGHLSRLTPSADGADIFQNDYLNGVRDAWNAVLGVSDIALVNINKLLPPPKAAETRKKEAV